ncbi:MAG: RsmB/NOP family class I SAM-dependent RNA methyltransferase [Opitutales bacterium]|nr:RsmB/NOP family class I SAM-dependent RNA methyltransferase [Opitutales bacterium]MCH8541322.1 hypothetical protein [Opitutales bacterium]
MNDVAKRINPDWQAAQQRLDSFLREKRNAGKEGRSLTEGLEPRARELVSGVLRHRTRLESFWQDHVKKPPKGRLRVFMLLALWDAVRGDRTQSMAQVVDHAVSQIALHCSPREKNFANAVLRKAAPQARAEWTLKKIPKGSDWPVYFSHPASLVQRWRKTFGTEATAKLLAWNNTPGQNFLRWRDPLSPPPETFVPTPWDGFYHLPDLPWPEIRVLLDSGKAYIQDPATRGVREFLDSFSGTRFLDACAAPGGKTLLVADTLDLHHRKDFQFVAMDKEGPRLMRLQENLQNAGLGQTIHLFSGNLGYPLVPQLHKAGLPPTFDAILLDVPCSNTGVFRRRPEARWHWSEKALASLAGQQLEFLQNAASAITPSGLLLYSTCSLEEEENQGVVDHFLNSPVGRGFMLEKSRLYLPWIDGHDGAGLFALRQLSK